MYVIHVRLRATVGPSKSESVCLHLCASTKERCRYACAWVRERWLWSWIRDTVAVRRRRACGCQVRDGSSIERSLYRLVSIRIVVSAGDGLGSLSKRVRRNTGLPIRRMITVCSLCYIRCGIFIINGYKFVKKNDVQFSLM